MKCPKWVLRLFFRRTTVCPKCGELFNWAKAKRLPVITHKRVCPECLRPVAK